MTENSIPWSDCKVSFPINDDDALWMRADVNMLNLPYGWELVETDGSGGRIVAIFRVSNDLTIDSGNKVLTELRRHGLCK